VYSQIKKIASNSLVGLGVNGEDVVEALSRSQVKLVLVVLRR
jgi:hypothetical protein